MVSLVLWFLIWALFLKCYSIVTCPAGHARSLQHRLEPACHSPKEFFILRCLCSLFTNPLSAAGNQQFLLTCSFKTPSCLRSSPHSSITVAFQSCFSHIICCFCAAGPLLLLTFKCFLLFSLLPDVLSTHWPIASPSVSHHWKKNPLFDF